LTIASGVDAGVCPPPQALSRLDPATAEVLIRKRRRARFGSDGPSGLFFGSVMFAAPRVIGVAARAIHAPARCCADAFGYGTAARAGQPA
jgi:hypothetical protein